MSVRTALSKINARGEEEDFLFSIFYFLFVIFTLRTLRSR